MQGNKGPIILLTAHDLLVWEGKFKGRLLKMENLWIHVCPLVTPCPYLLWGTILKKNLFTSLSLSSKQNGQVH